jgi:uncharacterized protein (DUF58 family)
MFLLGIALGNSVLVYASVPIVLYLILSTLTERPHTDLEVERVVPMIQVHEGDKATAVLKVRNVGRTLSFVELLDALPQGIEVTQGGNHVFAELKRGETREFAYGFSPSLFGTYTIGPIMVRSLDRFNVRAEETTLELYDDVRVYPEVRYISGFKLHHRNPRNWPGEDITRKAGAGTEFYGIREYLPGESVRRVNWKASSRTDKIMVNQYLNEAGGEVVIVLDASLSSDVGRPPESTFVYSVRAAGTISYRLLRDRHRVGLLGMGDRLVRVPPGFGRRQFDRILAGLISVRLGEDWRLGMVSQYASLFFSKTTQVVLVTSLLNPESYSTIVDIGIKGHDVVVISPSPLEVDTPKDGDVNALKVAIKLARLERERRLSSLLGHAKVVDWNPRLPLGDALLELKEPWQVQRRI